MSDPIRKEEKVRLAAEKQTRYDDYVRQLPPFTEFGKIKRLNRNITITEKIDGTNAAICIVPNPDGGMGCVYAQSRTRIITREQDNYGFAAWVEDNEEALHNALGPGVHFGEWWGKGIQRNYGAERKYFSLFNFERWANDPSVAALASIGVQVVPVLYHGPWMSSAGFAPDVALEFLRQQGSQAAYWGFNRPEGIVVYHKASGTLSKATLENDEQHKFEVVDDPTNTSL